ncbi:hypothetical protein KEM52_005505 [Ascosphaera acerosa]|nr:hypothetical protein KEM52_005505 [Ascosphaera acerosa]
MRSPPPAAAAAAQPLPHQRPLGVGATGATGATTAFANPYQPAPAQGGSGTYAPALAGFMNDPAAHMGFQVGRSAITAGHEYMEQNLNRYVSIPALKHYFNVSNRYVLDKLALVLFPWRHKPWSRQQTRLAAVAPAAAGNGAIAPQQYASIYLPPRDDLNSPDMYIPVMSIVTYILLSAVLAGFRGNFHPELLGSITTSALAVVIFEIVVLKVVMYLLSITNDSQLIDLLAYSGYKFVGAIVVLALSEIFSPGRGTGGWVGWSAFIYTWLANAFFLLRSLRYVILPDASADRAGTMNTVARSHRNKRTQFLFVYAYIFQFFFMWLLSREDPVATTVVHKVAGSA